MQLFGGMLGLGLSQSNSRVRAGGAVSALQRVAVAWWEARQPAALDLATRALE